MMQKISHIHQIFLKKKQILFHWLFFILLTQVRGLTDNNALNYRADNENNRVDTIEKSTTTGNKKFFERKTDAERDADTESDRDHKDKRDADNITIQDFKEFKERDRDTSTTHSDHSSNKRRRKNSSNCDNSLISTYNTNIQERHYSQDSQVRVYKLTYVCFLCYSFFYFVSIDCNTLKLAKL